MNFRARHFFGAGCALLAWGAPARALTIDLDYTYDTANFFALTPLARAAVEKAASDLGSVLGGGLKAVPADSFSGTNGVSTATFNWSFNFDNPSTGAPVVLDSFTSLADHVRVFVGMRPFAGSTLGVGGPAGGGFSLEGSGSSLTWIGAVTAAQNASNAAMVRGAGPIVGTISGQTTLGTATAAYTVNYGAIVGSLSLDNDSNNDGFADSSAQLSAFWQFDSAAPVSAGKNDLYTVALHEMMHALGFGTSTTWDSLRNGTTWLGPQALALSTGVGLVTLDGHIASSVQSVRLIGGAQKALMDASLTTGTRKYLTQLDTAILRDIGYAAVPEPASSVLLLAGALGLLGVRLRGPSRSCSSSA